MLKRSVFLCGSLRKAMLAVIAFSCLVSAVYGQTSGDFQIQGTVLVKCTAKAGNIAIPAGVTAIGDSAFQYRGVTGVTIPEGVKTIGSKAFFGCWALASVTIPASVTSIGDNAFGGCGVLKKILLGRNSHLDRSVFPSGVSTTEVETALLPKPEPIVQRGDFQLQGTVLIDYTGKGGSVTIPSGITTIGPATFANCEGLTSVTIPMGVTTIRTRAFDNCRALTNVTIPASVTSIGSSAFSFCYGLTSITIPASVTTIEDFTFYFCRELKSITIPTGVTTIGDSAFNGCKLLEIRLGRNSRLDRSVFPAGVSIVLVD